MANEEGLGLQGPEEKINRALQLARRAGMTAFYRDNRFYGTYNTVLGGAELLPFEDVSGDGLVVSYRQDEYSKGVFAQNPANTPRYSTRNDTTETMARLLIPLPSYTARRRFVESFGADSAARELAEALAVTEESAGPRGDGRYGMGYIDFLLMAASESLEEKVQVVDVLSDNYVSYFFGEHPPIFQYQGKLLNTEQDDWRAAFFIIYNSIIRGTQLARQRRLVTLTYDKLAVTGTVVGMNQTLTGDMEMASDFSFRLLVKRFDVYRRIGQTFNPPSGFPKNVVNPGTFGGLQLRRVRRTFRVVGEPQFVTSQPQSAPAAQEPSEQITTVPLGPRHTSQAVVDDQITNNVYNQGPLGFTSIDGVTEVHGVTEG